VTCWQVKLDGVFYDDDVADWRHEGATGGARDAAAPSVDKVRTNKQGIHGDDEVTFNTGISMRRATEGESSSSQSAEELFQALKAKLEVRRSARDKTSRERMLAAAAAARAHLSCFQADIASELRIYEQLNGVPPPLDIAQPPENTPPAARAGDAAANVRGNAGYWRDDAPTPSQLLGFDIAEV
jgi:hypothetical protein